MNDDELVARVEEARRRDPEPGPTKPQVESRERFDEDMTASWNAVATLDPLVDRALRLVADRVREVEAVAGEVTRTRELASRGRVDPDEAEKKVRDQLDREEAASKVALDNARKLVDLGRERLLAELVPEPSPNGTTTREAKDDITMVVGLAGDNVREGFVDAARRAIKRGDKRAIGLLMGEWGEVLYRSRGGDAGSWSQLKAVLIAELAEDAQKRSPGSKEARTWALVRDGSAAHRYITGQGAQIVRRLGDVPR